jgi:hypothetical protein
VLIDEQESPLGWLARRRGRDAKALIAPHQLQAGERLRADFTLADAAHDIELGKSDVIRTPQRRRRGRGDREDGRGAPARIARSMLSARNFPGCCSTFVVS